MPKSKEPRSRAGEKRKKEDDDDIWKNLVESDGEAQHQMSAEKVRQLMLNAQRMIEERKRMLNLDQRIPIFNQAPSNFLARPRGRTRFFRRMSHNHAIGQMRAPFHQTPINDVESSMLNLNHKQAQDDWDEAKINLNISTIREQIARKLASGSGIIDPSKWNQNDAEMRAKDLSLEGGESTSGTTTKPVPLLLDEAGRPIDNVGKTLRLPTHKPTLKANIRAQKRAHFSSSLQGAESSGAGKSSSSSSSSSAAAGASDNNGSSSNTSCAKKHFDDRLAVLSKSRWKKGLKFNEPGKFVSIAHRQRMQRKLAFLQKEIAEKARVTGISAAARLAQIPTKTNDSSTEYVPQMEWWDSILFENNDNDSDDNDRTNDDEDTIPIQKDEAPSYSSSLDNIKINNLIEHPVQLKCPTDPINPVLIPVFLTTKERKKLRRQKHRQVWKEIRESIHLGLCPPPSAKVNMSNLMRALGLQAIQDPTKVEAAVKKQMAIRLKTHGETNQNRKLTVEQKRERKIRKLKEDTSTGVSVSVYRIDDLSNQSKKFKVETNAKQLYLSGCILLHRDCNLVIVEGGPKQQKKYRRLMMNRIKWDEDVVKSNNSSNNDHGNGDSKIKKESGNTNKCVLVWEGMTKARAFNDMKFKIVKTEEEARSYLQKYQAQNYWDSALSQKFVLEHVDNTG